MKPQPDEQREAMSDEQIVKIALDLGLTGIPSTFVRFARAILAASRLPPLAAQAGQSTESYSWAADGMKRDPEGNWVLRSDRRAAGMGGTDAA